MKCNGSSAHRSSIKISEVRVPKILTYEEGFSFLKSVEIGTVLDMKSKLCGEPGWGWKSNKSFQTTGGSYP